MRSTLTHTKSSLRYSVLLLIAVFFFAFAAAPLLSRAQTSASISVVNNSSRTIRNIFLSPANSDDWGDDQLPDGSVVSPGGSYTISNVSCPGSEIKVVAEDTDGCFVSKVVACSSDASVTITNDDTPNCGSN